MTPAAWDYGMDYYFYTEKMKAGYRGGAEISDIEIGLNRGEILTLIGPNGAGKTTVLKSIARQLEPLGGKVFLDGRDMARISGKELSRGMAVLMTGRMRTELMTCRDVAATGRYPYTGHFGLLSENDKRAVSLAMDQVRVSDIADRDFARVSDGQRQRVMLARAVCQEPEILIMDEPTSYLDVKYKLEFLSILQKMQREKGLAVILSLHELDLAARISDRILCLNGAYADRYGTPEEIFTPGYISKLYGITAGSYDEVSGDMELERAGGEPEVFVIAGGGAGRNTYHALQRRGIPFAAGIVYKNDLDYPPAHALAARCFDAEGFEPVPGELVESARACMEKCGRVILCKKQFGTYESACRELAAYAWEMGYVENNHGAGDYVRGR